MLKKIVLLLLPCGLWAQRPSTQMQPTTVPNFVMVRNRAAVLGDRASASGTRYFSVQNSDLAGKSTEEVLKRLSPSPVSPSSDGIRSVVAIVDLRHPLTVVTTSSDPVLIGATLIHNPVRPIEVRTSILTCDVRIIRK
jgi:hypothetical protein